VPCVYVGALCLLLVYVGALCLLLDVFLGTHGPLVNVELALEIRVLARICVCVCDVTHSYVTHDSFICNLCVCVRRHSFICVRYFSSSGIFDACLKSQYTMKVIKMS